ncbi:MAG: DUF4230 domain-containing protein [Saccharofermentans sp.]|nr:DUF4230 domain-containing protein [Saccharofermentans sp.]
MARPDMEYLKMVFRERRKTKIILVLSAILVIVIAGIITTVVLVNKHRANNLPDADTNLDFSEKEYAAQVIENKTTIDDIIGISELRTLDYEYQAICRVYSDVDHVSPVYYIAYEATVNLGINTENIEIDYGDESDKTITVVLPPVGIVDYSVDAGTLEYLFVDQSYNNTQTSVESQSRCENDLVSRVREDAKMFELAKDNTEAEIRALTEPLVRQFYPDYELEIIWKER